MRNKWNNIILHCSDSSFGSSLTIDSWHKEKGWSKIGYHYVISNGFFFGNSEYTSLFDGQIEPGRNLNFDTWVDNNEIGSHALGYNSTAIGICFIGVKTFTEKQMQSGYQLINLLLTSLNLSTAAILGHYQTKSGKEQGKTCPNFDVPEFIRRYWGTGAQLYVE